MIQTESDIRELEVVGTSTGRPPGPLTYFGNRAIFAPQARVPGTLRIALVGDSMTYGAGLSYRRSLAARLAVHLNGALPELWTDCVALGVPGACLHHAAGRVVTQALPLDPDIIVLCVCRNDAMLLGSEPARLDDLGKLWLDFQPLMRTTLAAFRDVVARGRSKALVLYHDWSRDAGAVCLPDQLARLCADLALPFLDVSAALTGYPRKDVCVSEYDGHLNAFANDIAARQVAQFVIGRQWAPASKGFADAGWIEAIERTAEARIDAGLPTALALADALAVLEGKWLHRRNTNRRPSEARYADARQRLLDRHGASLRRLAFEIVGRILRAGHPLVRLTMVEQWSNEAMAGSFALEHLIAAGRADRVFEHLDHIGSGGPVGPVDLPQAAAAWERIRQAAIAIQQTFGTSSADDDARHDSADLQYFNFWTSRVSRWVHVIEQCAARYLELLPRLPDPLDPEARRLVAWADGIARSIQGTLGEVAPLAQRIPVVRGEVALAAGTGWLMLELVITADSGDEMWALNVGVESLAPAWTERHLGCANLIRDGQPHSYEIEIPLTLAGDVHVRLFGPGIAAAGQRLRIHLSRLRWLHGNLPDVALPRMAVESLADDSIALVCRDVRTLPHLA